MWIACRIDSLMKFSPFYGPTNSLLVWNDMWSKIHWRHLRYIEYAWASMVLGAMNLLCNHIRLCAFYFEFSRIENNSIDWYWSQLHRIYFCVWEDIWTIILNEYFIFHSTVRSRFHSDLDCISPSGIKWKTALYSCSLCILWFSISEWQQQ